ncbi:MAG: hypothetical protein FJZ04_01575 [Candidatus Moranbacteria bacterium]|nr:hypothetical protein [Candidatus Moranbacteria bacterium]
MSKIVCTECQEKGLAECASDCKGTFFHKIACEAELRAEDRLPREIFPGAGDYQPLANNRIEREG